LRTAAGIDTLETAPAPKQAGGRLSSGVAWELASGSQYKTLFEGPGSCSILWGLWKTAPAYTDTRWGRQV